MGPLSRIAGLWKIKWVPYAISLWVASVGGVSLYSYMKGKAVMQKEMARQIAAALEDQIQELERVHDADLKTLARTVAKEQGVKHDIGQITFPEMDEHCRDAMYDWMRSFNDAVHATGSNTE